MKIEVEKLEQMRAKALEETEEVAKKYIFLLTF